MACFSDYSAADGVHLRFTACKAMVSISRNCAIGLVKPDAWVCVSLFLHQCEAATIRREMVEKLKKGLVVRPSDRMLPMMWAATLATALVDKDKSVRDVASDTFATWTAAQRQRSTAVAAQMAAKKSKDDTSKFLIVHMPEYVLVYMVFLLTRHPLAPKTAEEGMEDRGQKWHQVQLILSAAISSLTHGTNGDAIPVTCKMLRRLKTTLDKVTPSNSDLIYSLSDLALLLVNDQAGTKGWDTSKFPGHIVYPTQLYKTTAFMASGPPVKEGAQPGLGDYSHLPRGYVIVRSVPITSTSNAANKTKAAQKRSRSKASTSSAKTKAGKPMKQTKLSFAAGTLRVPCRRETRDDMPSLTSGIATLKTNSTITRVRKNTMKSTITRRSSSCPRRRHRPDLCLKIPPRALPPANARAPSQRPWEPRRIKRQKLASTRTRKDRDDDDVSDREHSMRCAVPVCTE